LLKIGGKGDTHRGKLKRKGIIRKKKQHKGEEESERGRKSPGRGPGAAYGHWGKGGGDTERSTRVLATPPFKGSPTEVTNMVRREKLRCRTKYRKATSKATDLAVHRGK